MRRAAQLLIGFALLTGCHNEPTATAESKNLESLRQVTTPFQNFAAATAAGWAAQITPCMTSPDGGMGFHYGNTALIDGILRVEDPELLLYEPDQSGALRLVAVEYIVPFTAHGRGEAPPVLFGQQFKPNDTFQLWGLHVWAWKDNPGGLYADWNPRVSCEHTTNVSTMTHH